VAFEVGHGRYLDHPHRDAVRRALTGLAAGALAWCYRLSSSLAQTRIRRPGKRRCNAAAICGSTGLGTSRISNPGGAARAPGPRSFAPRCKDFALEALGPLDIVRRLGFAISDQSRGDSRERYQDDAARRSCRRERDRPRRDFRGSLLNRAGEGWPKSRRTLSNS
jgi:hypothetical protein